MPADLPPAAAESTRPRKVALVFTAGGSLGAVQVGMVRALHERGVQWDFMVGTSAGALNAGFLAGYDDYAEGIGRLEAAWGRVTRPMIFRRWPPVYLSALFGDGDHMVDPRGLRAWIQENLRYEDLSQARHRLYVTATDLLTGDGYYFGSGPALTLFMASSAIPVVFPPVRYQDKVLVDGGVTQYSPLTAAIRLGATHAIVCPAGFTCTLSEAPRPALSAGLHSYGLVIAAMLVKDIDLHRHTDVHVCTVPPLCPLDIVPSNFDAAPSMIQRAHEQTLRWIDDGGLACREIPSDLVPGEVRAG